MEIFYVDYSMGNAIIKQYGLTNKDKKKSRKNEYRTRR